MKLENYTDLNAWAVEQWGDAELGDTRRTQRAIAIGAAIAANPQASRCSPSLSCPECFSMQTGNVCQFSNSPL
ncbi:hypothetical protein NSTC745_03638 [Nostoc sp. DSM 114161]|jgi:hypothetical protein|uniref:IS4/Tn5 family transposase DNA-binding protein n=1 Tax=Nostoc sp. DSM 114161 TaxID=3440143 RepID=UPI0040453597